MMCTKLEDTLYALKQRVDGTLLFIQLQLGTKLAKLLQ